MLEDKLVFDETLMATLRNAKAEEVDLLVDVVTDFGRGRAGLDTELKKELVFAKHSPLADRYHSKLLKLLGAELQQFGGNSAMNLMRRYRGKAAVPYSEVVDDVYKKLNGKSPATKSVEQKERELALALFGANWRDLPAKERYERSTSVTVLAGAFSIGNALGTDAKGASVGLSAVNSAAIFSALSIGLRLNPVGLLATAGLGIHSAVSEAYRITVPFIAQIGWIRLRQEADLLTPSEVTSQQDTPAYQAAALRDLVMTDENGRSLMKISVFEGAPMLAGRAMPSEQVSKLNPLLANIPGLAALAEQQNGTYVLCSIPFEALTAGKNEGTARAWVTEAGRIKEHAFLSEPEKLQNVMVSGAVWNIVSSAVGQKHLHDISEKLTAIKRQLDDIQADMENSKRHKLTALVKYVQSLLDHFPQEGISANALAHLEDRQVDMVELEQYFQDKMKDEAIKANQVETGNLFSPGASRTALLESLAKMEVWAQSLVQVAQLRIVSYALLHMGAPSTRYRAEAMKVLDSLEPLPVDAEKFRQIYSAQLELTNSRLFSTSADQMNGFAAQLAALDDVMRSAPTHAKKLHKLLSEDQRVLLRVENGQFSSGDLLD